MKLFLPEFQRQSYLGDKALQIKKGKRSREDRTKYQQQHHLFVWRRRQRQHYRRRLWQKRPYTCSEVVRRWSLGTIISDWINETQRRLFSLVMTPMFNAEPWLKSPWLIAIKMINIKYGEYGREIERPWNEGSLRPSRPLANWISGDPQEPRSNEDSRTS